MHTGVMADDDIERLLREVNALNSGATNSSSPQVPATSSPKPAAKKEASSAGGRLAFAVGSGVIVGALGAAVGAVLVLLPFVGPITTGVGAAFGAFVTALIAGPPRWFSS